MEEETRNRISVVECIPLTGSVFKDTLSYFTSLDIPLGAIIKVPLRNRRITALVVAKREATEVKTDIKKAGYALRKIERLETVSSFPPELIQSASRVAQYYAAPIGQTLHVLLPGAILEQIGKIHLISEHNTIENAGERFVIQAPAEERFAHYKSLIREEFAKHSSIFFCLPTIEDVKRVKEMIEKGIEPYTFAIHGSLSKKEIRETWNKIMTEKHPVVIVATGTFLSLPRKDIGTIIVERESSRSYKTLRRPFVDFRKFADFLAEETKRNVVWGDTMLRLETINEYKNGSYIELIPVKFRSHIKAEQEIVDMQGKKPAREEFSTVSPALLQLIENTKTKHERLFIFTARKGLASSTVCQDCGRIVLSQCARPMILHKGDRENFFFCPVCKEKRSAKEVCAYCGSWRLMSLGIGTERVEEEIKEKFPKLTLWRLDKESAPTHKRALEIARKFEEHQSGVLLGTEMALLYLSEVDNVAVASIDALFSVPDFRINEKILYILLALKEIALKKFVIQTRNPTHPILEYCTRGNLIDFYKIEMNERKSLLYPPYSVIIKIRVSGERSQTEKIMEEIAESVEEYKPNIFPSLPRKPLEKNPLAMVIKVPKEKWVDQKLLAALRSLPPHVSIEVDPDNLL